MAKFLLPLICCAGILTGPAWSHPDDAGAPPPRDDTKDTVPVKTGSGSNTFATVPNWGGVPDKLVIGPTHGGVAVDKKGSIYVSSDSAKGIFVFGPDGTLQRTMAGEFSGIHGLCLREENGEEVLYAAHLKGKQVLKLKLDGTVLLKLAYPKEANVYPEGRGYSPTSVAVAPDGSIFVADGYGLSLIHKYDAQGNYLKTFGSRGKEPGQFETCHGIAIDSRSGKPLLLVCDRENRRLQHFDLDGNFVAVITTNLRRPCSVSIKGENVAIAELAGRVAILDKTNAVVSVLGDNPEEKLRANFDVDPSLWKPGVFTAPHGVSYDAEGNLYVQDWNKTGRVTKLVKAAP